MTESVEWARLADHDRPEQAAALPCEAAWWPVMADKRLNDIGKALVVTDGPTIAHELYDEVQRLRTLEESYRGDVRRLRELAETAERELAELRERIGEQREEWGVRTYDSDNDTEVMRTREQAEDLAAAWRIEIPGSNPTVRVRTQCAPGPWRNVEGGEWKPADGA